MDAGVSADAGAPADGGASPATTDGGGKVTKKAKTKAPAAVGTLGGGGCNCRTAGGPVQGDLLAVLPALGALLLRRRRRA